MEVSILLKDQSDTRKKIVTQVKELGVTISPEKEGDIKLAVGEAFANCFQGKKCSDNAEVEVLCQNDDNIVLVIKAPCYADPEVTRGWFTRPCLDVDPSAECGRGGGIILALVEDILFYPGSIHLIFDLTVDKDVQSAA